MERGSADADARRAAVIGDRQPLEVGRQRVVGSNDAADVPRVMDRRVEVGVVADARRQRELDFGSRHKAGAHRFAAARVCAVRAAGRTGHGAGRARRQGRAPRSRSASRLRAGRASERASSASMDVAASAPRSTAGRRSRHRRGKARRCRRVGTPRTAGSGSESRRGRRRAATQLPGRRVVGVVQQVRSRCRAHAAAISASSKIATARVQPADAPRILCGKQLM